MTTPFPATYSTLCPTALSTLITEKYSLSNVQCKLLVRGVGDTYLIESSRDRFILRIYRASHRNLSQITSEVDLLLTLKKNNISVSFPITDTSGATIQTLDAIEGKRFAVLFSYAPGNSAKKLSDTQLRILGREMARFHNISSTLTFNEERWRFDLETTLSQPLEMLRYNFTEDPEVYTWLHQAAEQVKQKLSQLNTADFSTGYCHFDFLPKNFHFENDSITIFDFDFVGYGWLVNDIVSFWQHLMLEAYTGRTTRDTADKTFDIFLDAYREHRPVSESEQAAIPWLTLGFWLFYMGFHTTHDQFYTYTQPAHLKAYTGFLKYIVDNFWSS